MNRYQAIVEEFKSFSVLSKQKDLKVLIIQKNFLIGVMGCLGLGCVPWPWLRAHGDYLGLGCMPWLWQHAHGGLLWPSPWQHAHGGAALALALASCLLPMRGCLGLGNMPMGAALALVACPGLGNLPMGATCFGLLLGYMPWPWLRALALAACPWGAALALAAACPDLGRHSNCFYYSPYSFILLVTQL